MKRIVILTLVIGFFSIQLNAQDYPNVLHKFRYLSYFSPAMAGMNDNLDINLGLNIRPSDGGNFNTQMFSAYYSTGANHFSRNSIRGTQSVDDYYSRRKSISLKFGFGTTVISESVGNFTRTYNSNSFAVHVPIADHTYLSMGIAMGFNISELDVAKLVVRDPSDPLYVDYLNAGDNTSFRIDGGIAVISDDFYLSVGLNNLTNVYVSGNEGLTTSKLVANFMGGYRVYHSNDVEIMAVSMVNTQQEIDAAWTIGVRGRYRQILMAGFNYTGQNAFVTHLGVQMSDVVNAGYSFSYNTNSSVVLNVAHEIGIGIRLMNHNKYIPIW